MTKLSILVTILIQAVLGRESTKVGTKCRILSLRGGGVHGSFEAGVLKAFVDHMPIEELEYDYVAGVSIGAYNAAVIATFEKGEEKQAAEYLSSLYVGKSSKGLFEFRSPLIIKSFTEDSLADNTNFRKNIEKSLGDKPWKRKISILAADLLSGQPVFFDETTPLKERV